MIEVPLSQGKVALIDDEDKWITKWKWCYAAKSGAVRSQWIDGKKHKIIMARVLLDAPTDLVVDHINHNILDNRRSNLRLATHSQNQMNRQKITGTLSKYKGVTRNKRINKWQSQIKVNGKSLYLGSFLKEKDAAIAYIKAAKKYFGKYYCSNVERP